MNYAVTIPLINFIREIYFDDEPSDEENVLEKVNNFCEITVPLMENKQFQQHFRMHPTTFEDLLRKIHMVVNLQNRNNRKGYPRTPLEKELMITIWYLGNIESYRSVADRFGVTKSTCWDILHRICKILLEVNAHYHIIAWPNRQRQLEISFGFTKHNFTGVIGCIDGSHIRITAPKHYSNSYVNRKGYHSLLLQACCDHKMLFTDIYTGEAGSLHDYTLYRKSDLFRSIQAQEITFHNDYFLIGDLAYKLDNNLLVGFKDNGHLTARQKNFNRILSSIRMKIENALALLKGRFRRLKFLETIRQDIAVLNIMGACILHNICILNGDLLENFVDIGEERRVEIENGPNNVQDVLEGDINNAALLKRNNIVNQLPMIIRE